MVDGLSPLSMQRLLVYSDLCRLKSFPASLCGGIFAVLYIRTYFTVQT